MPPAERRPPSRGPRRPAGRDLDPGEILRRAAPGSDALPPGHRSGFVAIIGRPNVGKSTLLNRIIGEKLAIVTRKPGTTRRRLLGILTRPEGQAAFFDTPGLERPASKLGRFLLEEIKGACSGADVVLFMTEAGGEDDLAAFGLLGEAGVSPVLAVNKVDRLKDKARLLPLIERLSKAGAFSEVVPISALTGENVEALVRVLMERLPEGPRHFSPGVVTDAPERVLVEEFVREQVYRQLHREVPYAVAVRVAGMERDPETGLLHITADVFVERKSQRGILVGKGGARIRSIGQAARGEIERRLGEHVFLGLHVHVKPNWRQRDAALHELGYENE